MVSCQSGEQTLRNPGCAAGDHLRDSFGTQDPVSLATNGGGQDQVVRLLVGEEEPSSGRVAELRAQMGSFPSMRRWIPA